MKSLTTKILKSCLMTGAVLLSLWGGAAFAISYDLVAGSTTVTMPDGKAVTMWGYGKCTSTDATFANCSTARVPGPPLTVTDGALTINLRNDLPEPTSIVINGQNTTMTPVWIAATDLTNPNATPISTGSRPADFTSRVRSFTHEAAPGGTATYTWAVFKPGTYLYQTGTHPSKQVQMGLYGAVKADSAANEAYPAVGTAPAVTYTQDVVVLFSEIDPALHDAVAPTDGSTPTFGTAAYPSTIDYKPKYFLINGKPFGLDQAPLNALTPANPNDIILLRLLNAGLDSREVVAQGERPTLYAEDGNRLPYSFQNNGVLLAAGKTLDVTITPTAAGYIPIFDRRLALSTAGITPGGMFAYVQVGAAADTLTVSKGGTGTGSVTAISAPGGLFCGGNSFTPPCTQATQTYLPGTELILRGYPDAGSALDGWTGCIDPSPVGNDCLVSGAATVTANFRQVNIVKLLHPNGNEQAPTLPLVGGTQYTITWEAPVNAVKFNLAYTLNGGLSWRKIAAGVTGNSVTWNVPILKKNKQNVRVRVVGLNAKGRVVGRDKSDFRFTIDSPLQP